MGQVSTLQANLANTLSQVAEQNALILRLESDLSKLNEATNTSKKVPFFKLLTQKMDLEQLIAGGLVGSPEFLRSDSMSGQPDIIPILTSQRDRYRLRNDELEGVSAFLNLISKSNSGHDSRL